MVKRSFGKRLRAALGRQSRSTGATGPGDELRRLQNEHRLRDAKLVELPAGIEIENERGACYLRRLSYPLDHPHGDSPIGIARSTDFERVAVLDKNEATVDLQLEDCLFLDTETTGLAGGAGTVVFMVGLGFFDGDSFVLEQTFLRTHKDEPAALQHVAERLREHPHLVTFVGKSFDRHRLASRMALHGVRSRVLASRHLDLYWLARRAWGDVLPNVRLQTVEREKLGLHRPDDLPGAEAPQAFLDWIRDGKGEIERVFEHNRLDVLTLVTLLAALGRSG